MIDRSKLASILESCLDYWIDTDEHHRAGFIEDAVNAIAGIDPKGLSPIQVEDLVTIKDEPETQYRVAQFTWPHKSQAFLLAHLITPDGDRSCGLVGAERLILVKENGND